MRRIAQGDEPAFEVLVCRYQRRILNLIYRSIGDRSQAEDLAQEVFLRVWRAAKDYRPKAKFSTWIYRIAANLCIDTLKSAHHRKSSIGRDGYADPLDEVQEGVYAGSESRSPEDFLLAAEAGNRILGALQNLPTNQRLALVLCKFDGLTYPEIGAVLGCSISAVESLLVRAKKGLRERLLVPERPRRQESLASNLCPDPEAS